MSQDTRDKTKASTARQTFEGLKQLCRGSRGAPAYQLILQYLQACDGTCGDLPLAPADVVEAVEGLMSRYPRNSDAYNARYLLVEAGAGYRFDTCDLGRFVAFLNAAAAQGDVPESVRAVARQEAAWLQGGAMPSGLRSGS